MIPILYHKGKFLNSFAVMGNAFAQKVGMGKAVKLKIAYRTALIMAFAIMESVK